jgi:hypothetical protein
MSVRRDVLRPGTFCSRDDVPGHSFICLEVTLSLQCCRCQCLSDRAAGTEDESDQNAGIFVRTLAMARGSRVGHEMVRAQA